MIRPPAECANNRSPQQPQATKPYQQLPLTRISNDFVVNAGIIFMSAMAEIPARPQTHAAYCATSAPRRTIGSPTQRPATGNDKTRRH